MAALIDSSHSCLVASGRLRPSSSSCHNKGRVVQGKFDLLAHTLSKWNHWDLLPKCFVNCLHHCVLHCFGFPTCSKMYSTAFQYFCEPPLTWFPGVSYAQNVSCIILHCQLNYLSINSSCPICNWASRMGWPVVGQGVAICQWLSAMISCLVMLGSVFCVFNHFVKSMSAVVQMHCASVAGHQTTCSLFSKASIHWGHYFTVWNFHHCIFFPCAKFPDANLDTHCCLVGGICAIALPIISHSMSLHTFLVSLCCSCNYFPE